MSKKPFVLLTISLALILSLSSCANRFIAMQMVGAPNDSLLGNTVNQQFERINSASDQLIALNGFERQQIELPGTDITLSYFDLAAGDYGYTFTTYPMVQPGGKVGWIHTHWQWQDKACFEATSLTHNRGTLLMLHGWARDNRSLVSYGIEFAQMGYRVIIPDLRGHGKSSGEWLSFGAQESTDISQFADVLGLPRFDVFGFSLGAATALQLAKRDPRVEHVIAVAPMHSIEETIPKFGARSRPWIAELLADREALIVATASEMTGFDYQTTSDTLTAASGLQTPTLVVYGENDQMSDQALNIAIFNQVSGQKQIKGLPGLRHTFVLQHQSALVDVITSWLKIENVDKAPVDSDCAMNVFAL